MKIKMTKDYSDHPDEPRKGAILTVVRKSYSGSYLEYYSCEWDGVDIIIYPEECEVFEK